MDDVQLDQENGIFWTRESTGIEGRPVSIVSQVMPKCAGLDYVVVWLRCGAASAREGIIKDGTCASDQDMKCHSDTEEADVNHRPRRREYNKSTSM